MWDRSGAGPSRRELLLLLLLALVTRALAAWLVGDPPYLDPAYYEVVARRLASGDGFSVPVLWSFLEVGGQLPADPQLPVPSNRHWMPLTSVVSALSMMVLGPSRLAAQLPMIVLGAALAPLTALVTWELWRNLTAARISALLAVFAGPMLLLASQVDNFAIFGVTGFGALYASTRAVRTLDRAAAARWLVLSGAFCGLATLARIDGLLLLVSPFAAWLARHRGRRTHPDRAALGAGWLLAALVAALVVLAPWLARQMMVFGSPFPSAGGHTLWITSYNDQFSINRTFNPGTYLSWGIPAIVGSKMGAWLLLLGRTAVLLGGIFVISFIYGMWRERHRDELAPFIAYFLVMFAAMGGVFTFHAPQGAYYHSALAWLPFAIGLSTASFLPMVAGVGTRWKLLARKRGQLFLLRAAVAGAVVLSLIASVNLLATWRYERALLEKAAPFFRDLERDGDVVMYADPPSLFLLTGNPAIAAPFDPFPVIGAVARAYDVRWVLLERSRGATVDALGLWEGAEAVDSAGNRANWLRSEPSFEAEGIRVYEVVP